MIISVIVLDPFHMDNIGVSGNLETGTAPNAVGLLSQ